MKQNSILNLQLYYLPVLTAAALVVYWAIYLKVPATFIVFCLTVPALFGALAIGLCSDRMKFWTYNVPNQLKIKGSSSHLMAVWYVGTLNFALLLLSESLFAPTNWIGAIKFVVSFTVIYGLLGSFLDILNVECGLLIVRNRAARKNLGTVRTVVSYGPCYFGVLGLLFGIESKMANYFLIEQGFSGSLLLLILSGFVALSIPFVIFFSYAFLQITKHRKEKVDTITPSTDTKNA